MSDYAQSRTAAPSAGLIVGHASGTAKRLAARIVDLLAVCVDAWAAAGLYEELSRLPDAELERRGIPRDGLNRCVFEIVTRHT
ncbi:MAG TPA: hypothetical protein VG758_24325 [Hyphomicrobiaceae bacterium]|jgi:hypothetical protein|nr:hypothetical protein [Hyphomicrobiaceae bacterium]